MRKSILTKLIAAITVTAMMILPFASISVLANEREYAAQLSIGGVEVGFKNAPYYKYETVFFPLEELCGYLNLSVTRSGDTYTIIRMGSTIKADVNNMVCELNGQTLLLQSPITERSGVAYASVELLSQGFNIPVAFSENKHSVDIVPNIYNVYIDENHAAAISAASPDKNTLAIGTSAADNLYYDNPTSPSMEKSLYYMIDVSAFKDKDISKAELVTTIAKGSNLYPTLGMVRTALWDKATINYNNQPEETEEIITAKMLGDTYKQSAKNYAHMIHDVTSMVKSSMIDGGIFSLKLLGRPYNHQKAETQVFVKGVNTPEAPYVKLTLNENFSFPTKKVENDFEKESRYTKINLLRGLGIFTAEDEFPVDGNVPVSRSEFLTYALRLRGKDVPTGAGEQFFSDVPTDAPYFATVMSAYELGYIAGWQGIAFRPDDAIKVGEAVTILGRMLNYDLYANQYGGFTPGYFSAAAKGDLYMGSNSETALLSFNQMIDLLENSLDAAMLDETVYSSTGTVQYTFNENKTILSEYWNGKKIEGTVTANEYSSLSGGDGEEGYITIHDGVFDKKLVLQYEPYNQYLGYKVRGWYNNDNELLYMGIIDGNTTEISLADVSNVSESTSGGVTTVSFVYKRASGGYLGESFNNNMAVIYNGKSVSRGNINKALLSADSGSIKIINDNLVIINAYRTVIVYKINLDEEIIYDIYDPYGGVIRLNNNDWNFENIEGKSLNLEDIKEGNVISAAVSLDGKLIQGIVADKNIEGKISSLENSGTDDEVITIGGNSFKTANRTEEWTKYITSGAEGKFYIDAFNNIVGFDTDKADGNLGYILTVGKAGSTISPKAQAAIMVQTSEDYKVYNFADKVKIDGATCKKYDEIEAAFKENGSFKPQGIIFDLNAEGKIKNVDTAKCKPENGEKQENTLYVRTPEKMDYKSHGAVGGKFNLNFAKGMVVYQYGEVDELDEYKTVKSLTNDGEYSFEMYTIGINTPFIKIAKLTGTKGNPSIGKDNELVIADKVTVAYNEDGYEVKKFYYHANNKGAKSIIVSQDFETEFEGKGISRGDIVRFAKNSKGELGNIDIYYDYDAKTDKITSLCNKKKYNNSDNRTTAGYTTHVLEDHIRISMDPTGGEGTDYYWENYSRFQNVFYKYEANSAGVTVSEATLADVREFEEVPYNPTGIIIQDAYTNIKGSVWLIDMPQPENTGMYTLSYEIAEADKNDTVNPVLNMPTKIDRPNGNETKITVSDPNRTNHIFLGWDIKGTAEVENYKKGDNIPINSDTTLQPVWKWAPTLNFTFVDGDGNSFIMPFDLENESNKSLPGAGSEQVKAFTNAGQLLKGWKLSGTEKIYNYDLYTDTFDNVFVPEDEGFVTAGGTFEAVWSDTYEIDTADELKWYSEKGDKTMKVKLTGDIYLQSFTDENWYETPANVASAKLWYDGTTSTDYRIKGFKGTFDGNGHTIHGLYIRSGESTTGGLFKDATSATIKNLTIKGAYIVSTSTKNNGNEYFAPLVGSATSCTINNITTYGKMAVDSGCYMNSAGGVVGYSSKSKLDGCISNMNIDLTGCGTDAFYKTTYNATDKKDSEYNYSVGIGGIVGRIGGNASGIDVQNCTNKGNIYAPYSTRVGGILGSSTTYCDTNDVNACTNNAVITGAVHDKTAYNTYHVHQIAGFTHYTARKNFASGNTANGEVKFGPVTTP